MRFMMIVKHPENQGPPPKSLMNAIAKLSGEADKAGTMLGSGGLAPTAQGARVRLSGGKVTVTDGPFTETKELIAGFWLWQVRSLEEAIEWVKRCPNPHEAESEIEIRQVFESEDFGAEFTPELKEKDERLRAQVAAKKK